MEMYNLNEIFKSIKTMNNIMSDLGRDIKIENKYKDMSFTDKETICRILISGLKHDVIPIKYPDFMLDSMSFFALRDTIIQEQGFALVSKEWIEPLAKFIGNKKCLEIMAGCGSLSYALKEQGINIIATDNFSWNVGSVWDTVNTWIDIENIDCVEAINKYGADIDIIIVSWPYMDDNAYKSLLKMREINPKTMMIYIGEGQCGCTADDNFFETMKEVKNKDIDYINTKYQKWYGIHDYIALVK